MATTDCQHPIFKYLGAHYWGASNKKVQRYECVDCGHQEREVLIGSVMIGHAPGECSVCDKYATTLPVKQLRRWIELTAEGRL